VLKSESKERKRTEADLNQQIPPSSLSRTVPLRPSSEPREQAQDSILDGTHVDELERSDGESLKCFRVDLSIEVGEGSGMVDLLGELFRDVGWIARLLSSEGGRREGSSGGGEEGSRGGGDGGSED